MNRQTDCGPTSINSSPDNSLQQICHATRTRSLRTDTLPASRLGKCGEPDGGFKVYVNGHGADALTRRGIWPAKRRQMETEECKLCGPRDCWRKMTLNGDGQIRNLAGSGKPLVMCQAMYAIVGAVALQRGGKVANEVVRERILKRLGTRQQQD